MDKSVHVKTALSIKGSLMVCCFHQFLLSKQRYLNGLRGYFHRSCNLVHIVSFGIYCSVLECGRGLVGWGGLISNLNSVRLRITAASWKKGYSCYISFFTNFALIYWTCLIGFGGKSHRFWNLLLCLGMGEGTGRLGRPYIKFELCLFAIYSCVLEKGVYML